MAKTTFEGIEFDSQEEVDFYIFLQDCSLYGLVESVVHQPGPYELVPKAVRHVWKHFKTKPPRQEERTLFQGHNYTPDFEVRWTPKFLRTFPHAKLLLVETDGTEIADPAEEWKGSLHGLIDVKGGFNRHGGDRIFPIHQKLMWHKYHLPVTKVVPDEFFVELGVVPDRLKWMKNRKTKTARRRFENIPTFEDTFEDRVQEQEV